MPWTPRLHAVAERSAGKIPPERPCLSLRHYVGWPSTRLSGAGGAGLAPGCGAQQQSEAVEAEDDGGAFVAEEAEGQREVAGQVPGGQGGDDDGGYDQVRGYH